MAKHIEVVPLGGLEEIGKNMMVIGYNGEYVIVDVGMKFPDENMYGVGAIIPDFEFVKDNINNIKAVFITHGHEDHIGGLPYFVKRFPKIPIYATELTRGLIKNKFKYHKINDKPIEIINADTTTVTLKHLKVSFFKTIHSIYDSVGIIIDTPEGKVVHTGDFKIDHSPINVDPMDLSELIKLGESGVKLLISDSTNSEKEGTSSSETVIAKNLEKVFNEIDGRIIISTFASSLSRVSSIFDISSRLGKKVFVMGVSMRNNVETAKKLGFLDYDEEIIIENVDELNEYDENEIVILSTGAQGERLAGLSRLAYGENDHVKLKEGDTVILSSGVVPGNEKSVSNLINHLMKTGVNVIRGPEYHTSGHAYEEELKLLIRLLKPEILMPSHGEYKMLKRHKEIGELLGIDSDKIILCQNGDTIRIRGKEIDIIESPKYEPILIDVSERATVGFSVLKDRERMSQQGMAVIQIKVFTRNRNIDLRFELKGIAININKQNLRELLIEAFRDRLNSDDKGHSLNRALVSDFSNVFYKKTKVRPLIVPLVEFIRE